MYRYVTEILPYQNTHTVNPQEGRLLEILHFQEREQGKTKNLKNSIESDIEDANACFNLLDKEAEDYIAVVQYCLMFVIINVFRVFE